MKLVGYEALFLPLAIRCGFTKDKLVSIIIMLGSASTVTCFVMAKTWDMRALFLRESCFLPHYSVPLPDTLAIYLQRSGTDLILQLLHIIYPENL